MVFTTRLKVLCAAAVATAVYIVASAPEPAGVPVQAAPAPGTKARTVVAAAVSGHAAASAAPSRAGHRVAESKAVEALFHTQSWYVPPPPPAPAPVVVVAPPPPTAPPLPFTVMGSYVHAGDPTVYFLTRGDSVFDVRIGDTIDNLYSVDGAANGMLLLTYKPLDIKQTLPLGDSQ